MNFSQNHDFKQKTIKMSKTSLHEHLKYLSDPRRKSGNLKEVIAIDGKTLRRSKDTFHNQPAIHIVNAWASSNQLILGQLKTADKSNELRSTSRIPINNIKEMSKLPLFHYFYLC